MLGSLIGMAGSIAIASMQAKNNNKAYEAQKKANDTYASEERNRYDRLRNADTTQLAQNSAALTEGLKTLRRQTKAAEGTQAVMGGSNASVAAAKERANETYADMIRKVSAQGTAYRQHLDDQYSTVRSNIRNNELSLLKQRQDGKNANLATANAGLQMAAKGIDKFEGKLVDSMTAANGNDTNNKDEGK